MSRYLKISLAIGGAAALVSMAFHLSGLPERLLRQLGPGIPGFSNENWGSWPRAYWLEFPLMILGAMGVAWSVVEIVEMQRKWLVSFLSLFVVIVFAPVMAAHEVLFDPISPGLAVVLAASGALLYARTFEGRKKQRLISALGHRVSARVFTNLLESSSEPDFKTRERLATVVVCRLLPVPDREKQPSPAEMLRIANFFRRSTTSLLLGKGALLEEESPDRVRVTFGLIWESEKQAGEACSAALELRNRLRGLSREIESRWFLNLRFGIGVATRKLVSGICDSREGSFFGSFRTEGEFAERLSQANAVFGSEILIDPETLLHLDDRFLVRPMEMLYEPSNGSLTEIYELLAPADSVSAEEKARRDLFWEGVVLYRSGNYEAALDRLSRARIPGVEDGPVAYLVGRIQERIASPGKSEECLGRRWTEEGHARLFSRI